MYKSLCLFSSLFIFQFTNAQVTVRLKPDESKAKDAVIISPPAFTNTNYGQTFVQTVAAWTWSGVPGVTEGLFDFNWSLLPPNTTIYLAKAKFFAFNGQGGSQEFHSTLSGPNDSYIERVITPWDEHLVTYTGRPTSTVLNRVYVPQTDSVNQDIELNLTTLANDILQNPTQGYGFLWKMANSNYYRRVGICSSAIDDISKRPEILLTFKSQGVTGTVMEDANSNCIADLNEMGVDKKIVEIQPGNYVAETNEAGIWHLDLPAGSYTASILTPGSGWSNACTASYNFTVASVLDSISVPPFLLNRTSTCTAPEISIYSNILRRCFSGQEIYVNASNTFEANAPLLNAYAEVKLDPLFTLDSATQSYTSLGGNLFRFNLNTLDVNESQTFTLYVTLSCDAVLLETLCHEAKLYPAEDCVFDTIINPFPPTVTPCELPWDKSSLKVSGWCENDTAYFSVINHGTGDMACYAPVRVYRDGILITIDSIMLQSGDSIVYSFAGNGQTWILQADQHPLHPGHSRPNAHVEACGNISNWTPDIINDFPHDNADPVQDVFCTVTNGAYDPNDKRGFPSGLTASNFVLPNQEMEYIIRFQNTGTDTAFTVVVRDTLDENFEIQSVHTGVTSHPYSFRMYGPRVMEWRFDNILLVDSTTNEPDSHGFIQFKVKQKHNLPNGTLLNNDADIYFDFNVPVITNNTSHIVNSCLFDQPIKQYTVQACDSYTAPNGNVYDSSGYYSYSVSNGLSCDSLILLNLNIGSSSAPTVSVLSSDSDLTVCDGENVQFTANTFNGGNAPSYVWKVNGTPVGTGSSFSTTQLNQGDQVSCELTSNATCPSQLTAASAPITINVLPVPSISISSLSSPSVCSGTDGSIGISGTSSGTISWTGTSSGSLSTSLPATIGSLSAGVYSVSFTDACVSNTVDVNISDPTPPATPVISLNGSTAICEGSSLTLTSSVTTGIIWSTGQTGSSIVVNAPGDYFVKHTNGACSSTSALVSTTLVSNPVPSVASSGSTTLCSGETVVLTSSPADSYTWSNGANTQSITVSNTGNFSVTTTTGACSATSASTTVNLLNVVQPMILVGGSANLCSGDSILLTAVSGSNLSWSTGESGNSIIVKESGTYTVTSSNGNCQATSNPAVITVFLTPSDPVIMTPGTNNICEGEALVLTSSAASGNVWSNGSIDPTTTIFVAGTYTVSLTENGCTAVSEPVVITSSTPPVVTISSINSICDTAASFVLNQGLPVGGNYTVNGVASTVFDPTTPGTSTIIYTYIDGNGCSGEAETSVIVDNCSGISTSDINRINLYPNPTQSVIYIDGDFTENPEIEVLDALGRSIMQIKAENFNKTIDLSKCANGMYTVMIRLSGEESRQQIQVMK